MPILLLTLGSRGDVQPFAVLAAALQARGHDVLLGAPDDAAPLVKDYGVPFAPLGIDFTALVQSPDARLALRGDVRAALRLQRATAHLTERTVYAAGELGRRATAIIYHPKVLNGRAIGQVNDIPTFEAMALPGIVPTRDFPLPVAPFPRWRPTNRLTYRLNGLGRLAYRRMLRRWADDYGVAAGGGSRPSHEVLYAYSPALIPRPSDWPPHVNVTGYWRDRAAHHDYSPASELAAFLEAGKAPVYIGFGSMAPTDPAATVRALVDGSARAGLRVVLGRGWAGLGAGEALPPHVHPIGSVPHDWLFPRCRAVVHHGGSGTTHAGLRHGRPTLVCPFFGDQPFWGRRIAMLGCGPVALPQKRLTAERFAGKLRELVGDEGYARAAERIGGELQREDGVANAVACIEAKL